MVNIMNILILIPPLYEARLLYKCKFGVSTLKVLTKPFCRLNSKSCELDRRLGNGDVAHIDILET